VYVAQDRLELALKAYTKAISLSSESQKKIYKTLHDKIQQRLDDTSSFQKNIYNPNKSNKGTIFERLRAVVPNAEVHASTYPSILGYLTAADKVCEAYSLDCH
jgi:hypothetical protein